MLVHATLGAVCPGWGIGELRLGMNRDEVKALLGDPEVETDRDEDGDACLEYPGGAHLYFDHGEEGRLNLILLEDASALHLMGAAGSPVDEASALTWIGEAASGVDEVEFLREDGHIVLARSHDFGQHGVVFFAEDGLLDACGVFVVFDETDQRQWPAPRPAPTPD